MTLSRRRFVRTMGVGGIGALTFPAIAARGHEASAGRTATAAVPLVAVPSSFIRIDSNENPNGPGAVALEAIRGALSEVSRYPDRPEEALREALARTHGVSVDNVVMGCGSTEILRMAVHAFTGPTKPLVTAAPTFEDPSGFAAGIGAPVLAVPVDGSLKLDLIAMTAKAASAMGTSGAGLIYVCNPNNPTATARTLPEIKDLVTRMKYSSPETALLIDEAYQEYVDDSNVSSAIPLAMENPRLIVSRTFSKVYGLAGLRVGYAVGSVASIDALLRQKLPSGINLPGAAAALATRDDKGHLEIERRLNRETKDLTRRFFESAGYKVVPSQTNFMMVDIRRDVKEFRAACRRHNVLIGRSFPPLTSHARISMGTMDEMRQAVEVFRRVL